MMNQEGNTAPDSARDEGSSATVAFCQQCGRALSAATVRPVGSGIFCEPCATLHQSSPSQPSSPGPSAEGHRPVNAGPSHLGSFPPPVGAPNPVLAGLLGFIPGVGAMYNGQYPKGIIHLVIFVVLTSLSDNLNWVLWWFVWGWIFYQAFEAYHTAQARRDGLPLPDPFGWNDLGDRLGFTRTGAPVRPSAHTAEPNESGYTAPPPPASPVGYTSPESPIRTNSFTQTAPPRVATTVHSSTVAGTVPLTVPLEPLSDGLPPETPAPAPQNAIPLAPGYSPIYTGTAAAQDAVLSAVPQSAAQRFPIGAAWLVGLGLLFLLANLAPAWRFQGRWLVPILLAVLALWIGGQRVTDSTAASTRRMATLADGLLGPALLLTVAALLALQAAGVVAMRHSWPAFLIVWGAMLFLSRSAPSVSYPPANGGAAETSASTRPPF